MLVLLQLLAFAIGVTTVASQDDLPMCGGFVKPSAHIAHQIKVKLYTKEGYLKSETDCSPVGYYFLPLYDQGEFSIRLEAPPGWGITPTEYNVVATEMGHSCSEDQNFVVTGFQVSGRVADDATSGNPDFSSVSLSLAPSTGSGPEYSTIPNQQGQFSFENVPPGRFKLKASHDEWALTVTHSEVTLKAENVELGQAVHVSGYPLTGSVEAPSGSLDNVVVLVDFEGTSRDTQCITPSAVREDLPSSLSFACATTVDSHGRFTFARLPPARYIVNVLVKSADGVIVHVDPPHQDIELPTGGATLPATFHVTSFDAPGRVLDFAGKPMAGIVVRLGDAQVETDASGRYTMPGIPLTDRAAVLEAGAAQHNFKTVGISHVNPLLSSFQGLPDIQLESVRFCGRVILGAVPATLESRVQRRRTISLQQREGGREETVTTADDGTFCFNVRDGEYDIAPKISADENTFGLRFNPPHSTITVAQDGKRTGVAEFRPAQMKVSGTIDCLASCGKGATATLRQGKDTSKDVSVVVSATGAFEFDGVWPGDYTIIPSSPIQIAGRDAWCWSEAHGEAPAATTTGLSVTVKDDDVTGIRLRQTGFVMELSTDVATHVDIVAAESGAAVEPLSMQVAPGLKRLCLAAASDFVVHTDTCYQWKGFPAKEGIRVKVAQQPRLELHVEKYLVRGTIQVVGEDIAATKPSSIHVDLEHGSSTSKLPVKEVDSIEDGTRTFEYSAYLPAGATATFRPHDDTSASKLLFYPATRTIRVPSGSCPSSLDAILARQGLHQKGSIAPPLAGVEVTVRIADTEETTALAAIEDLGLVPGQIVATAVSDGTGVFTVGPLHPHLPYEYSATKAGYHFQQTSHGIADFVHKKLGSVRVIVNDMEGNGVGGVLLSLSGFQFRSNNATGADGEFHFKSLFPGKFFLRPMLKEYNFLPPSQEVEVEEGADSTVTFTAQRYAYSVYGLVLSLNGAPQPGITVVATSNGLAPETSVTDSNGVYRIRGLRPGNVYTIAVDSSLDNPIVRSIPGSVEKEIGEADVHNVRFSILRTSEAEKSHTISGFVKVQDKDVDAFAAMKPRAVLMPAHSTQSPVDHALASITLGFARVFEFNDLEAGEYKITLLTTHGPALNKEVGSAVVTVGTAVPRVSQPILFRPEGANIPREISTVPLYGLLLVCLVSVFLFKGNVVKSFFQGSSNGNSSGSGNSDAAASGSSSTSSKKKKNKGKGKSKSE